MKKTSYSASLNNSEELERTIIGELLLEPLSIEGALHARLRADHFSVKKYQEIYSVICGLYSENKIPDIFLIAEKLGGNTMLSDLVDISGEVYTAAQITEHSLVLIQKFMKREQLRVADELRMSCFDGFSDPYDTITEGITSLESIFENAVNNSNSLPISEVSKLAYHDLQERKAKFNSGRATGVTTGLKDFDNILDGGMQPKDLIIIAARPSMGKTAFALKLAKSAAMSGTPVYFVSLEMDSIGIYNRLLLSETGVFPSKLKTGALSDFDEKYLKRARNVIDVLPITIEEGSAMTIESIANKAILLNRQGRCGIIMCDYLGFLKTAEKAKERRYEIGDITKKAKSIAKKLNIPFVMLCQLNRESERRTGNKPELSDLRESGDIEQDADVVAMLYRSKYYDKTPVDESGVAMPINTGVTYIHKNRNGMRGKFYWSYSDDMTKITDYNAPATNSTNEEKCPF